MRILKRFHPTKVALVILAAFVCVAFLKSVELWRLHGSAVTSSVTTAVTHVLRWQPEVNVTPPTFPSPAQVQAQELTSTNSTSGTTGSCKKKTNVLFLKVHKAGSTTLSNMFFRFAIRHNLNIALPNKPKKSYGFNFLGEKRKLDISMLIPVPKGETYNIVANHAFYNRTAFQTIMPPDTVRIAIMRDPESQFISAAYYYQLVKRIQDHLGTKSDSKFVFSKWLENPWKMGVSQEVYNSQAADFGLPHPVPKNPRVLDAFLQQVAADFRFVMLLEYMDESIVLLRRLLCWEIRDVIHIRINVSYRKHDVAFHEEDRMRLRKWLHIDYRLYDTFSKRFWKELHAQGMDFFDEVAFFRGVLRQVEDFCTHESVRRQSLGLVIPRSRWSEEFTVTLTDCLLMTKHELALQGDLIDRAWAHFSSGRYFTIPAV